MTEIKERGEAKRGSKTSHDAGGEKDRLRQFGRQPCNDNVGGVNGDGAKQVIDAEECLENVLRDREEFEWQKQVKSLERPENESKE